MRDPERIHKVTKELTECWFECPELRFGQLVENIYRMFGNKNVDMWEMEEAQWLSAIEKYRMYCKEHYKHPTDS